MEHSFTRTTKLANYLVAAVLVLVPFHAFLTIWFSTFVGHYTLLRLWDDVLLAVLLGITGYWLITDTKLRHNFGQSLVVRLILAYIGLTLLLGIISFLKSDVTAKALGYGLLVNLRFLAWFVAVNLVVQQSDFLARHWRRALLMPALIVVLFAVLQYLVLPHNFLSHFGYNAQTNIAPIETINHNTHYIRAQSTLRGANPLGVYLITVITGGVLVLTARRPVRRLLYGIFGALCIIALYASGSRSAWIGTLLGLAVIAWFRLKTRRGRVILGVTSLAILALGASGYLLFRGNVGLQNTLLHTQNHSAVATTSNSAHVSALRSGLEDVVHQPFGDGPGTAGPASEYNGDHSPRIAENYYVQIAQEVGWLGLALFVSIAVLVAMELYQRIGNARLALALLASFIGIAFVCLLSHAWTDDTLAFTWWGLAGIAVALPIKRSDATGE